MVPLCSIWKVCHSKCDCIMRLTNAVFQSAFDKCYCKQDLFFLPHGNPPTLASSSSPKRDPSHLMLSSHLPQAPFDKFVYDVLCSYLGIIGGYCVCVHIVYEHRAISCMGPRGQAGVNPYRGCVEIVQKSCNLSGVAVQSPQPPDGNRTEPVRPLCGACAGIVWCHLRHVYRLRMDLQLSNLYNFLLNKIVEATEPMNPYENLTPASCLRTEASRRPHRKGDTGRIQAP